MNILFVVREIPYPPNSGVRMRVWNVLERVAQNHRVALVCYGNKNEDIPEEVDKVCSSIYMVDPVPSVKGLSLYFKMMLGLFSGLPHSVKSRFSPLMKQKVKDVIDAEEIDFIMCDSLYLAMHIPFDGKITVLNEHNIESVIIERYARTETNILRMMYASYELGRMRRFEDKTWASFDQCYVCSDVDKREIEKRTSHKNVVVVPNGVDVNKFKPEQVEHKRFSLVYTGLISWKPNEDAVLYFANEIYPLIKKKISEINWCIVGKGPCSEIKNLAVNDSSITVTGFVDSVAPYMLESEVFIVPLRIGSGTRLKILEAWAMGKAVVSTSIGCEGLGYSDGKNIVVADDPQLFADKIIELLNSKEKRQELEANGRVLAEAEYSWEVIGSKIQNAVNAISKKE